MINIINSKHKAPGKSGTLWKEKNLWLTGIEEGKETESKDTGNNFNNIIKKIFPNWKNELPVMVQKHTEHQID